MKKSVMLFAVISCLTLTSSLVWAGNVTIPNVFTHDTPARADSVNENFPALGVEVDDNDSRLDSLESQIYFSIKRSSSYTWPDIASARQILFDSGSTIWENQGNAFNQTTSTFYAPEAGIYSFDGAVYFQGLTQGDLIYIEM